MADPIELAQPAASQPIANPPLRLLTTFQTRFPDAGDPTLFHAPEREVWMAFRSSGGTRYGAACAELKGRAVFDYRSARVMRTLGRRPLPRWARYPARAIVVLDEMGMDVGGFDCAVSSDEPAGVRYEYALALAFAALVAHLRGETLETPTLTEIADRVHRDITTAAMKA